MTRPARNGSKLDDANRIDHSQLNQSLQDSMMENDASFANHSLGSAQQQSVIGRPYIYKNMRKVSVVKKKTEELNAQAQALGRIEEANAPHLETAES